jgi:hypothetical protein
MNVLTLINKILLSATWLFVKIQEELIIWIKIISGIGGDQEVLRGEGCIRATCWLLITVMRQFPRILLALKSEEL